MSLRTPARPFEDSDVLSVSGARPCIIHCRGRACRQIIFVSRHKILHCFVASLVIFLRAWDFQNALPCFCRGHPSHTRFALQAAGRRFLMSANDDLVELCPASPSEASDTEVASDPCRNMDRASNRKLSNKESKKLARAQTRESKRSRAGDTLDPRLKACDLCSKPQVGWLFTAVMMSLFRCTPSKLSRRWPSCFAYAETSPCHASV